MPLQAHNGRFEGFKVRRLKLLPNPRKGIADPLEIQTRRRHQVHHPVALHVFAGVGETLRLHPIHVGSRQPIGWNDLHGGAPTTPALGGGDGKDAVGVHQEFHLNLRNTGGHGRDPAQVKARNGTAVSHQLAFPLQDMDPNIDLPVNGSREHLSRSGWNAGIAHHYLRHCTPHGFDTKGERHHVHKQQITALTCED